ncbi:MAG: hypothetical protein AB1540_03795 [Bdellovibrionota bacterium]
MRLQVGVKTLSIIMGLTLLSCSKFSVEQVLETSTDAYPVVTETSAAALESVGSDSAGVPVTSVVRIQMKGIANNEMESVRPDVLVLEAREGDLRFVQRARFYVQSQGQVKEPFLIGEARADRIAADGKTMRFLVDNEVELGEILKNPFSIIIDIEGNNPTLKTSVSGLMKFKVRLVKKL